MRWSCGSRSCGGAVTGFEVHRLGWRFGPEVASDQAGRTRPAAVASLATNPTARPAVSAAAAVLGPMHPISTVGSGVACAASDVAVDPEVSSTAATVPARRSASSSGGIDAGTVV